LKRNERKAFNELKKLGAPVIERPDGDQDGAFVSSGEENYDVIWAQYWRNGEGELDDFGVNKKINAILAANGLFAEWINPGFVGVNEI